MISSQKVCPKQLLVDDVLRHFYVCNSMIFPLRKIFKSLLPTLRKMLSFPLAYWPIFTKFV